MRVIFLCNLNYFCIYIDSGSSSNILKNHGWNFIKPCIHIHIYRTNMYGKKLTGRG